MPDGTRQGDYDPARDGWEVVWSCPLPGEGGRVAAVACAVLDGREAVVAAGAGAAAVWDAASGEPLAAAQGAPDATSLALAGPDGGALALVGGGDGSVRVWDLRSPVLEAQPAFRLRHGVRGLSAAAVGGRVLALAASGRYAHGMYDYGRDDGAEVWDVAARRRLAVLESGESTSAVALASFGGRAVAVVAATRIDDSAGFFNPEDAQFLDRLGSLALFDAATGAQVGPVAEPGSALQADVLAPLEVDGRLLVFGGGPQGFFAVDAQAGEVLAEPSWPGRVRTVAVGGPARHPLVLIGGERSGGAACVRVWDPRERAVVLEAPLEWTFADTLALTGDGGIVQPWAGEVRLLRRTAG